VTHARVTDDIRDRAALHALGALNAEESSEFEAHLAGCRVCRGEVDAYAAAADTLASAAPPVVPPHELRQRVLAAARRPPLPPLHFILGSGDAWTEVYPGVARRDLAADPASPAYLIRLAPGAFVPTHGHGMIEHCYVLSGEVGIVGRRLGAGDYHRAAPGTVHERVSSETGCVLLLIESRGRAQLA
jgi:anti-sigma factor ChrR (cupin superfamily)